MLLCKFAIIPAQARGWRHVVFTRQSSARSQLSWPKQNSFKDLIFRSLSLTGISAKVVLRHHQQSQWPHGPTPYLREAVQTQQTSRSEMQRLGWVSVMDLQKVTNSQAAHLNFQMLTLALRKSQIWLNSLTSMTSLWLKLTTAEDTNCKCHVPGIKQCQLTFKNNKLNQPILKVPKMTNNKQIKALWKSKVLKIHMQ